MDRKQMLSFTDSEGREWHPVVTARVIKDFEKITGTGLLEAIFDVFIEEGLAEAVGEDGKLPEVTNTKILRMARKVFGHIGHVTYLLYEACRGTNNEVLHVTDKFRKEVSYNEFCQAIGTDEINEAMATALAALFDFFPEMSKVAEGGGAGLADSPPEDGPGKTSMS